MPKRLIPRWILLATGSLTLLMGSPTEGKDASISLQGLFCNTQKQIDEALAFVDQGMPPKIAADLSNKHEIVCTYADLIYFVVKHPIEVGAHQGRLAAVKYEATLTGVIVGGLLRPVSPTMRIFFVTPQPLAEISLEQRT